MHMNELENFSANENFPEVVFKLIWIENNIIFLQEKICWYRLVFPNYAMAKKISNNCLMYISIFSGTPNNLWKLMKQIL